MIEEKKKKYSIAKKREITKTLHRIERGIWQPIMSLKT